MTDADDAGDKLARSFLESQRLNRLAVYVSRGRKFGALTIDAVEDGWHATMKAMSLAPSERAHRDLNSEYEAELELRGSKPPFDSAKEDVERYLAATKKIIEQRMADPDEWERMEDDLVRDLERDTVTLDGKPVRASKRIYLLLYKPKGYITTYKDPEGRPTVYDLIQDSGQWVVPVGRLDQDTSGLLLLTNDTHFAELVTNPDYKISKTYLVKASTLLNDDQLEQLRKGVMLKDGPTQPALVKRVRDSGKYTFLELTIREGRNRQVRRMIEAIGSKVLKLVRTEIGGLRIGDLPIGKYRELLPVEVKMLIPLREKPNPIGRPGARRSR